MVFEYLANTWYLPMVLRMRDKYLLILTWVYITHLLVDLKKMLKNWVLLYNHGSQKL
jgi:hypothetical protein